MNITKPEAFIHRPRSEMDFHLAEMAKPEDIYIFVLVNWEEIKLKVVCKQSINTNS